MMLEVDGNADQVNVFRVFVINVFHAKRISISRYVRYLVYNHNVD